MKVLLIGATGFSGQEVLKALLSQGHSVTAITRNANSLSHKDARLKVLEGSVLNPLFLEEALAGQDAVINCLGIDGTGPPPSSARSSTSTGAPPGVSTANAMGGPRTTTPGA